MRTLEGKNKPVIW